ncbi:uncharacterized protein LOC106154028 [Lingula anatina]|uniref:Uncharacterized protein LOC106154028 n=1 Tax=Lingula anatina TaxID=7574 RepID=A0A1S3HDX5_LINAN|nr:uncharacterized protein LOC106154028 [Lingula anatina]XP_013383696.1 uncharacterized protein LOC106154028 [Lingula anatina]|eukprot:XP_013383695.1 uncharacterized protein LOC106154028 [Lingula anatina]
MAKMQLNLFLVTTAVSWILVSGSSATSEESTIDAVMSEVLSCLRIPGLSVTLVKNGRVILAKGYGTKDKNGQEPVTSSTLFSIGSLTKAFSATLLSKILYEKGHDLETPLTTIGELNDLRFSTEELTAHVTARDLLSHRTGIPSYDKARLSGQITLDNIAQILPLLQAAFPLRSKLMYNNLMYGLVGHVTQRLTRKPWSDAMQDELLKPIGMRHTAILNTSNYEHFQLPTPYDFTKRNFNASREISPKILKLWSMNAPSMAIVSDSVDMGKWILFHLNEGRAEDDTQVIPQEVLAETYRPVIPVPHPRNKFTARPITPVTFIFEEYGCAWKVGYYRGYPLVTHSGSTHGFSSILTFIPSMNIGAYLNFNTFDRSHFRRRVIMAYLLDILLEETPWLNSSSICTFPAPFAEWQYIPKSGANRTRGTAARALSSYVGRYHHPLFGSVNVVHNATEPFLRMFYGPLGHWALFPNNSDEFFGVGQGAVWNFALKDLKFTSLSANNEDIDAFIITSFEEKKPPIFKKVTEVSGINLNLFLTILFLLSLLTYHIVAHMVKRKRKSN